MIRRNLTVALLLAALIIAKPCIAADWQKPWSDVKGEAAGRCAEIFPQFQAQAICMDNEKEGHQRMQSDFGMPNEVARQAKAHCAEVFSQFQGQAICMENEQKGFEKMKEYSTQPTGSLKAWETIDKLAQSSPSPRPAQPQAPDVTEKSDERSIIPGILILLGGLAFYLLPSLVARSRKHHQGRAIFVLNLLLGWTGIGWVIALVWAYTATPGA